MNAKEVTKALMIEALEPYGASVSERGFIVSPGGRETDVIAIIDRGKLVISSVSAGKLFSGPQKVSTVEQFVEKFWYWEKPTLINLYI